MLGWTGIIPHRQLDDSTVSLGKNDSQKNGASFTRGALSRLFASYPSIKCGLENIIYGKTPDGRPTGKTISAQGIHNAFIELCKLEGIGDSEYPFSTVEKGRKAIFFFRKCCLKDKPAAVLSAIYGSGARRDLQSGTGKDSSTPAVTRFYQRVEVDGHELPYKCAILLPGGHPLRPILKTVSALTLITVLECGSTAIIGYSKRFGKGYSSMDTFNAIRNAIKPWKPMDLDPMLGIAYPVDGGLPSGLIPELQWALWRDLHWDNYASHASEFLQTQIFGCVPIQSPVGAPDTHALIESFNSVLDRYIKNSECSTAKSPQKASQAAEGLGMTTQIIEQIIDVAIAHYNSKPPRGSNISRIQLLRNFAMDPRTLIAYVPEHRRANFKVYDFEAKLKIKGSAQRSKNVSILRPHLYYLEADYTSPDLADRFDLIGKEFLIRGDSQDLRVFECWQADGAYFGSINVCGAWAQARHGFDTRTEFGKLRRRRSLLSGENPIQQVERSLQQLAKKNSSYASALARVQKEINGEAVSILVAKIADQNASHPEITIPDNFADLGTMY